LNKIKVAAVNYLNTKPLLYGIKNHRVMNDIELYEAYPAMVAQMLLEGSADVGLIPVAVIPELNESHIITDYCIGCDGPVASVCIFSEVPMEKITKIYLDYQSRSSVMLAKILLKKYWKSNAEIIHAKEESFINEIKGTTAALVIGDRALQQRQISPYIYDLGEAWKSHTGLPFVFAAWVSNKKLSDEFTADFNYANGQGIQYIDEVLNQNQYDNFDLNKYYHEFISYQLDEEKRKGLKKFLTLSRSFSNTCNSIQK
jgi:chorismate dehydratase